MQTVTRREWLGLAASLSATACLQAETKQRSTIPLGFSLYGMKSLSLAVGIEACAKIGYDGIELALMPGYPAEPKLLNAAARKDLRARMHDARLKLHGLMENLPEPGSDAQHRQHLDRLKAAAELGHALSPESPPPIESILGGRPAEWETRKAKLPERLQAWAEVGQSTHTVIAIKAHVSNALHTIEGALWLLQQVKSPWLKLAFDYSHFVLRNVQLQEVVRELVPHSVFIHVKDARGTPSKVEFLLPGEGDIDYPGYVTQLESLKYAGPVVVEVSSMISNKPGYDPVAAAQKSYDYLRKAFRR